jgi:hypothetical protein
MWYEKEQKQPNYIEIKVPQGQPSSSREEWHDIVLEEIH